MKMLYLSAQVHKYLCVPEIAFLQPIFNLKNIWQYNEFFSNFILVCKKKSLYGFFTVIISEQR